MCTFPAVRAGSQCSHVSPITTHGPWNVTADADPHSCRPRGHTAHHHKDPRRETQKLNHTMAKAAATGSLCSAPSTCKRSGQLAPPARQRAACRAYILRRLDEEEDGGLDELSGELRRNRGDGAAEADQVHHGARAQRTLSSFPDSFSHLIIMAAFLTSSSTLLTGQPLEVRRGGGLSLDVRRKKSGKKRTRASRLRRRRWPQSSLEPSSSSRANSPQVCSLMADFQPAR